MTSSVDLQTSPTGSLWIGRTLLTVSLTYHQLPLQIVLADVVYQEHQQGLALS